MNVSARLFSIYSEQGGRCAYCDRKMTLARGQRISATLDHVIPLARGGSNRRRNIVGACLLCNQLKGNISVEEFCARLERSVPALHADRLARARAKEKRRAERKALLEKGLPDKKSRERAGFRPQDMGLAGAFAASLGDFWPKELSADLRRLVRAA